MRGDRNNRIGTQIGPTQLQQLGLKTRVRLSLRSPPSHLWLSVTTGPEITACSEGLTCDKETSGLCQVALGRKSGRGEGKTAMAEGEEKRMGKLCLEAR